MRRGLRAVFAVALVATLVGVVVPGMGPMAVRAADLSISGKVTGSAGNLGGIAVSGCTTDWSMCSDVVYTDEAGNFTLTGLEAGLWILTVETNPTYQWGFYKGPGLTQEYGEATPVDTTAGSVTLPPIQLSTAFTISGTLTGSAGGLSSLLVWTCGAPIGWGACFSGTVDGSGSFSIGGMSPGSYYLQVANGGSGPYVSGVYTGSGLSHQFADIHWIDVTDGSVVVPAFAVPLGVSVTGTLAGAVGQLGNISVSASEDDFDTAPYGEATSDSSGHFTISGLWPGSYRIHIQDWSNTYVSGTYSPDGIVQSDAPHTTVGSGGLDLGTIQLETASSIRGTVGGSAGPATSVVVTACREDAFCIEGSSDSSGTFSVLGMPAGRYTLQFNDWSGTYDTGYYSTSGIVGTASEATKLTVPPSISGLSVTLRRGGAPVSPAAPTNVVAVPGDGSVDVSWTAPLDDGGSPISGYIATASDGSTCFSASTSCTAAGLTNGQSYTFTVVAQNGVGFSVPSAPSDAVTPVGVPVVQAVRLAVTATPTSITAGQAVKVTVSALDADGNVVPSYKGTVGLSCPDTWAGLPEPYTFKAADAGVHQFNVALGTAGTQIIHASDGVLQSGQATVTVKAAAASIFLVSGAKSTVAGVPQRYTVTATDGYGNVASTYAGKVKIKSSDKRATLPASIKLTKGRGTLNAVFRTAGTQSFTISDTSGAATQTLVQVTPAKVARFNVTASPRFVKSGTAIKVTVTAVDRFGNVVTNYKGKVHFSSNDRSAVLPAAYTFTGEDAGRHAFTVTLKSGGARWIKVSEAVRHPIGGIVLIRVDRTIGIDPSPRHTAKPTAHPTSKPTAHPTSKPTPKPTPKPTHHHSP